MKKVLFVCIHNACRSQMAEAFFNKHAKNTRAFSAGSSPASRVDEMAIKVMREKGINLGSKKPKSIAGFLNQKFDFVVTMGCGDTCPIVPAGKVIDWSIEAPNGNDMNQYRRIRDSIEEKVKELVKRN